MQDEISVDELGGLISTKLSEHDLCQRGTEDKLVPLQGRPKTGNIDQWQKANVEVSSAPTIC